MRLKIFGGPHKRMNISVPQSIIDRMHEVETGTDENINWSRVASEAFAIKLGEIAAGKQEKSMADVTDRLRSGILRERVQDRYEMQVDRVYPRRMN